MYKFIKTSSDTNEFDTSTITYEIPVNDETVDFLVESFGDFLKGCGFIFHSLEVHTEDPDETNCCSDKRCSLQSPDTADSRQGDETSNTES